MRKYEISNNRTNHRLNVHIERTIEQWEGTYFGMCLKNMYENGSSYEAICDYMNIEYEDWEDE